MSAAELLELAQAEGVLLVLDDGRLTWEADHEPPVELLEEIRTHRQEIIKALNDPQQQAMDWLERVARQLGCSAEYLLERRVVDRHDLAECCHAPPCIAARTIRTHLDWHQPSERSVRVSEGTSPEEVSKELVSKQVPTETAEFRDQYAHAREGGLADAHSSATWLAARNALHRHAYGNCPHCYPPKDRYCVKGAELRTRYDHETHALEARNEESGA